MKKDEVQRRWRAGINLECGAMIITQSLPLRRGYERLLRNRKTNLSFSYIHHRNEQNQKTWNLERPVKKESCRWIQKRKYRNSSCEAIANIRDKSEQMKEKDGWSFFFWNNPCRMSRRKLALNLLDLYRNIKVLCYTYTR